MAGKLLQMIYRLVWIRSQNNLYYIYFYFVLCWELVYGSNRGKGWTSRYYNKSNLPIYISGCSMLARTYFPTFSKWDSTSWSLLHLQKSSYIYSWRKIKKKDKNKFKALKSFKQNYKVVSSPEGAIWLKKKKELNLFFYFWPSSSF